MRERATVRRAMMFSSWCFCIAVVCFERRPDDISYADILEEEALLLMDGSAKFRVFEICGF